MMAGEKKQRRIDRIDGRTVLFLTLCACLVTFLTTSFWGHGIFTFCIFLILCWFGLYKQALGCFAVYLVAIVWLMIETKYQISIPSPLLLSMIYKLLLPAMPAYLLAKIPSGKLTASLRKMPIPTRIMLVLIVMLRFAPTVLHEFGEVREAMKIRGFLKSVGNVLRHPMDTLELSYLSIYNNQLNVPKMHREMNNLMIIYGLSDMIYRGMTLVKFYAPNGVMLSEILHSCFCSHYNKTDVEVQQELGIGRTSFYKMKKQALGYLGFYFYEIVVPQAKDKRFKPSLGVEEE